MNTLEEIFVKSKIESKFLKNYFHHELNEFSIHNSIQFTNGKFLISGFGLFNLFHEYKLNFSIQDTPDYLLLKFDHNEVSNLIEFYTISNIKMIKSIEQIKLEYVMIQKSILSFYDKFSTYFSEIDNYFPMNISVNRMACCSFFILDSERKTLDKMISSNQFNFIKVEENFTIGEEIITLSSSLGVISYPHFSKSYSKGIISNSITREILLLDIRVLPNSQGGIISSSRSKLPMAIVLPALNVAYSYTPLIFGCRLDSIIKNLQLIYSSTKTKPKDIIKNTDIIGKIKFQPLGLVIDSVFIIYNLKSYATCFHIGSGLFITNKHFFINFEMDDEEVFIKNHKFNFKCRKWFIPNNSMDLAIISITQLEHYDFNSDHSEHYIPTVKINKSEVNLLQTVYSVSFSYFDRREIIALKLPNIFKGCISKKITDNKSVEMAYQIDNASYSGGSGCPVVTSEGELVGILFQNLTFNYINGNNNKIMQLPNSGFIIAKNVVLDMINCIKVGGNLSELSHFKLSETEIDELYNFNKFTLKPNF